MMASFRFYAELNDFLTPERRHTDFDHPVSPTDTVKHVIEALGVPHPEVDLILVNGNPVDFRHRLADGDRVSVYPVWESFDIRDSGCVRPEPLRDLRFVLDGHLGRLAAYLRMAGFDCWYHRNPADEVLAAVSRDEQRVLLTRDVVLLKRSAVDRGYFVRNTRPLAQLQEVVQRFDLAESMRPFTRCLECSTPLVRVDKAEVLERLEPLTKAHYDEFSTCPKCNKVYWRGSHYQKMMGWIDSLRGRNSKNDHSSV